MLKFEWKRLSCKEIFRTTRSQLKYNQSADTAIKQIKEKRYQGALSGYGDKIYLVGINYDAEGGDKKHHTCVIEEWME